MKNWINIAALISALTIGMTASALALPRFGSFKSIAVLPEGRSLQDGADTAAQVAFTQFCDHYSDQCVGDGQQATVILTHDKMLDLIEVNARFNAAIAPDRANADYNNWSLTATTGHCNEYAVQKRKALRDRGWPVGALSLTVVRTPWDKGNIAHMVLTVRTDRGDLVLDSLRRSVLTWDRTGYTGIMRQSASDPRRWVRVQDGATASYQAVVQTPAIFASLWTQPHGR